MCVCVRACMRAHAKIQSVNGKDCGAEESVVQKCPLSRLQSAKSPFGRVVSTTVDHKVRV